MKKLFLLLASGLVAFGANAQYARKNPVGSVAAPRKISATVNADNQNQITGAHHSTDRITSIPACITGGTETFGTGTPTTLPSGWTAGIISGPGTWHWANTAATSIYNIGTIHSTTASNGWMIFDSDSLAGGPTTSVVPAGWLQSPTYHCASLTASTGVLLSFQELYGRFQDSCFIWVTHTFPANWSTGTYSVYPVTANNSLSDNALTANPTNVHINITGEAAGYADVTIRFVYYGPPGGGYSWLVDDLCISAMCSDNVSVEKPWMFDPNSSAFSSSIFNTPLQFLDTSYYPINAVSASGLNAETNLPLTAQVFNSTGSIYSVTSTYAALSGNTALSSTAYDSLVQFPAVHPNAVGVYTVVFSAPLTTDCDLTDNYDTLTFAVTDTTWQQNQGGGGSYYTVHDPTTSFMIGTRFDVPDALAAGDTVTGFGVVFDNHTVPTTGSGYVKIQLYSVTQTSTGSNPWTYVAASLPISLTAANISTSTTDVWAYFPADTVSFGGWSSFVLQPGTTYAAVVQFANITTDLYVEATQEPNCTPYAPGYFGYLDTTNNGGGETFGSPLPYVIDGVPLIRMYFGSTAAHTTGIQRINLANQIGNAYPDPANTTVTIPFTLAQNADVTVTLTNMVGQVVATQVLGNVTNGKATFNTSALPAGGYIYTFNANNQRTVGHVVIAH